MANEPELTPEALKTWTDKRLAGALKFVGVLLRDEIGDLDAVRVCKEAARRLEARETP